jgi:hypothetical protein
MSLLSTDIAKVKRLSIREVKLPAPEVEAIKPIQVEKPPTEEERAYSKLVAINPLIEELVKRLDLVSIKTRERIRKAEVREDHSSEPEIKAQEVDNSKLIALAGKIIKGENSYSKEEIIARTKEAIGVSQDRAERGFLLMLQEGAIAQTINPELYYLGGSTPF